MAEGGYSHPLPSAGDVDIEDEDVCGLFENDKQIVVPFLAEYAAPIFCDAYTTSRLGYYKKMKRAIDNMETTRWPIHDVVTCRVDVNLVKLDNIPKAYNPVRALVLASQFDDFPMFKLATNCQYIVVPAQGSPPNLFTYEEYAEPGRHCDGAARMYIKNRKRWWKGDVYVEFCFVNPISDESNSKYNCLVFPPTSFNAKRRAMRAVERLTMLSVPEETSTKKLPAAMGAEKGTDNVAKEATAETSGKQCASSSTAANKPPEEPQDNTAFKQCTPAEERHNPNKMFQGMRARGAKDEFDYGDDFLIDDWTVEHLQQCLVDAGVCPKDYLSDEQWIHALRCCRFGVSFVEGPPGTGKTKILIIVAVALAIRLKEQEANRQRMTVGKQRSGGHADSKVKHSVIAIVAKTNKACSVIVEYLRSMWPNFTWVTSKLRERTLHDPSALHMMAAYRKKTDLEFTSWHRHFLNGTNLLSGREHEKCVIALDVQMQNVLNSVDIVVGTVARIESLNYKHFNLHIAATLVDEASQLTELEACAALTLYSQRVALFGDSKQLGPIWVRNEVEYEKLSDDEKADLQFIFVGWFNRMVQRKHYSSCIIPCFGTVKTIYRMPWSQTEFVLENVYERDNNAMQFKLHRKSVDDFYGSEMRFEYDQVFATNEEFFKSHRVAFVDTDTIAGCSESSGRSGMSLKNTKEAEQAVLMSEHAARRFGANAVCIICMYSEQMYCVEKLIYEMKKPPVKVSTVDSFRGDEADVVIVSTVRNNVNRHIGFLGLQQRANVALSRSREILIVLGSRKTLAGDPLWGSFVRYALNIGGTGDRIYDSAVSRYWKSPP